MSLANTSIFLTGYQVMSSIGVHDHERKHKQAIKVDIELDMGEIAPPKDDLLVETLNYEWLADIIETECKAGHVQLIETLINRIADQCLSEPRVQAIRVRIEKPAAIAKAAAAGVEIYRRKTC
ncbi:MAG: dihydroneopterin aldolase [Robiginitomaculum sp.]|nr:dihydroneopterin aldolase [Robiginitomaculum sp.]